MSNHTTSVPNVPYSRVFYDLQSEMVVFDALPSRLRKRIASAAAQIDVITVSNALHDGAGILEIITQIDVLDRRFVANAYAERGLT